MEISVNGSVLSVVQGTTVAQLIEQLELSEKRIAVEKNKQIISKTEQSLIRLKEGDAIEIIHAVGGG